MDCEVISIITLLPSSRAAVMISNSLLAGHWNRPGSFVGSTHSSSFKSSHHSIKMMMTSSLSDFTNFQSSQTDMLLSAINAWSVNGVSLNASDSASSFFAISLFPYLAMLFFLSRKETKTPSTAFKGFCFLLAFVAATIPAGIYAKLEYHEILANVDWLHGLAESLLTITNILIISGFRQTRPATTTNINENSNGNKLEFQLQSNSIVILGALLGVISLLGSTDLGILSAHTEPLNALSLPTWIVHSSSILEWLIAMTLVWDHAYTSSNPRWKGLTVAMIPAHASGICACAFHLFFNNPNLYWMVALQAGLTLVGNTCMAAAAYRIYDYERSTSSSAAATGIASNEGYARSDLTTLTKQPPPPAVDNDASFFAKLVIKSLLLAGVVKYGELLFDFPFSGSNEAAALAIGIPVFQNIVQWTQRSISKSDITYR